MNFKDCKITVSNTIIEIENSRIYRRWQIKNGLCYADSLKNKATGKEYLLETSDNPAPSPTFECKDSCRNIEFNVFTDSDSVVENQSLRLEMTSEFADYSLVTHFKIYPDTPAISQWMSATGNIPASNTDKHEDSVENIEDLRALASNAKGIRGLCDMLYVDKVHKKLGIVDFVAHTDRKDNLCSWKEDILTIHSTYAYSSNLFYFHDQISSDGLLFLKEAPLPHARPVKTEFDLLVDGGTLYFIGHGTDNLTEYAGYPFTVMVYDGGKFGRMKTLQNYQRNFRIYDEKRDDVIWHSTWGDRNADKIVSAEFMKKEVDDMHEAGGDFLYFSDGWQKGAAMTSLTIERYQDQWNKPGYWNVDADKFPNDLTEIIEYADKLGMMKGIWFCPDKTNEYENYKKDIEVLLNLYNKYGFNKIKYDAVTFRTKLAEKRVKELMAALVEGSNGDAFVESDITAGIRTDYFDAMQYGFLFLENRYTDFRRYYPHLTLRSLWLLSHYVDPRRLRIEFLNNERNKDKYPNDPLAPALYSPSYLYVITLFANPLMWFEISNLSDAYKKELKEIIAICRPIRKELAKSNVYPIGSEPDGFSNSGFISCNEKSTGYLCVYRAAGEENQFSSEVPLDDDTYNFELITGNGKTDGLVKNGRIKVHIPNKYEFALFSYSK